MFNSENYSDESISLNGGSGSGNKADSEGIEVYDKNMKEILIMMKIFNLYMYEPGKKISSTSLSNESDYSDDSSKESNQLEILEMEILIGAIVGTAYQKKGRLIICAARRCMH